VAASFDEGRDVQPCLGVGDQMIEYLKDCRERFGLQVMGRQQLHLFVARFIVSFDLVCFSFAEGNLS